MQPRPFGFRLQRPSRFSAVEIGKFSMRMPGSRLITLFGCLRVLQMPASKIFKIVFGCHGGPAFLVIAAPTATARTHTSPIAGCGGLGMHSQHDVTVATASAGELSD